MDLFGEPNRQVRGNLTVVDGGLSHGAECNASGQSLETFLKNGFRERKVVGFRETYTETRDMLFDKELMQRPPYTPIWGGKAYSDFLYVCHSLSLKVRIECKYQQSSGSVDEKLSYLLENVRKRFPEQNVWLVVDGGGIRPKALEWLKREAAMVQGKTVRVHCMVDLRKAIKRLVDDGIP